MKNNNEFKKLILIIKEVNYGLKTSSDWDKRKWYIYNDLTLKFTQEYSIENCNSYSYHISDNQLKQILYNINLAKNDNRKIDACDGSAWKFTLYEDDKIVWKRDLGYIYGINPLEKISDDLYKLVKNNIIDSI